MSARESIVVSHRWPYEPPPSPNSTVPQITAEIRLFFPPNVTHAALKKALIEAYQEAAAEMDNRLPVGGVS